MRTAVIVQARQGSNRLPGKVMLDVGGRTVLERVLTRCARIRGADVVVCAVPDESASEPLERVANRSGAATFCGSEHDVLARYLGAAQHVEADVILRVTSDCPLIDPEVAGNVLALRASESADYASNNMPRSYPHGLDCEAFTIAALVEADRSANEAYDREHVTPWLRRAPHLKRANLSSGNPSLSTHRWTLDFPEDLDFFRAVFAALPAGAEPTMGEVLALLARYPEFAAINANRHVA